MDAELAELQRFLAPDETLRDILLRTAMPSFDTGIPLIDKLNSGKGLGSGQVLEICGDSSSGKSALLAYVIARVLVNTCRSEAAPAPGAQGDGRSHAAHALATRVVLLDLDFRFSIAVLTRFLVALLLDADRQLRSASVAQSGAGGGAGAGAGGASALPLSLPARIWPRLESCLARLDVLRPQTSVEVVLALEGLLDESQADGHIGIGLLAMDGWGSSWQWQDRAWRSAGAAADTTTRMARAISRVVQTHHCRVIWCRALLFGHVPQSFRVLGSGAPDGSSPAGGDSARVAKAAVTRAVTASGSLTRAGLPACPLLCLQSGEMAPSLVVSQLDLPRLQQNYLSVALQRLVTHTITLARVATLAVSLTPPSAASAASLQPSTIPSGSGIDDVSWLRRLQAAASTLAAPPPPAPAASSTAAASKLRAVTIIAARAVMPAPASASAPTSPTMATAAAASTAVTVTTPGAMTQSVASTPRPTYTSPMVVIAPAQQVEVMECALALVSTE